MRQDDTKKSLICQCCLLHCWTGQGYKNKMKQKNEYRAVLFNICVFWIHYHTVWESMQVSHCCMINESILHKRFFNCVAPPLFSFVAIRDSSNEVKPAALGALTIIPLFVIYLDWLDRIFSARLHISVIHCCIWSHVDFWNWTSPLQSKQVN